LYEHLELKVLEKYLYSAYIISKCEFGPWKLSALDELPWRAFWQIVPFLDGRAKAVFQIFLDFTKILNVNSLEPFRYTSENSSPKGSFWHTQKKKIEIFTPLVKFSICTGSGSWWHIISGNTLYNGNNYLKAPTDIPGATLSSQPIGFYVRFLDYWVNYTSTLDRVVKI